MKAQNIFLDENTGGKGRYFKARFLQPGLVKYSFGVCLLEKETIDKFIFDFVGCPVIIGHNDVTNENKDELVCGNICHIWYDQQDGWYWGDGIIDNQEALDKIEDGFNVSCQYEITEYSNNTEKKLHNGNPYDKVILNGKPEHLAIVETPRYENAMIAVNAMEIAMNEDKDIEWITVKGNHIPVKKGQSKEEAVADFIESKQRDTQEDTKSKTITYTEDTYDDFHKKFYKDHNDKWTFQRTTKGFDVHRTNEKKKWEFKQDLKKDDLSEYLTGDFIKLRLPNIPKKNKEGKTEHSEDIKGLQFFQDSGYEPTDKYNDGYYTNYILKKSKKLDTAKNCIKQAINDIKETKMFKNLFKTKENKMDREELKELFLDCLIELKAKNEEDEAEKKEDKKAEEEKEAENKCKNEDVDKRDIIRKIAAIAGLEEDDEKVRTIIKLAEELAYDKSEAGTADNAKKAKCEDEEDEEEKKEKEEAKNKAKNSIEELKGLISSIGTTNKSASKYITKSDAIALGDKLFG